MTLESLVEEIRSRGEVELRVIAEKRDADLAKIASELEGRLGTIRLEAGRTLDAEAARERAQRLAAGHLAARRLLYEAREERVHQGFEATRTALSELTETPPYAAVLRRMIANATERLGKSVRISGRADDAALLGRLAGKAFEGTPRPILGGLIAETPDGRRRLDLSFDELVRQRADAVRRLLA